MFDSLALDKMYKLLLLLGYLFIIDKFDNPMTAYGLLVRHIIFIIEFEYTCLNLHLQFCDIWSLNTENYLMYICMYTGRECN